LEIYRTIIGTLQSNAWILLLFFLFALIAYVIVRGMETRRQGRPQDQRPQDQRQHDQSRRRHRNRPRPAPEP
jgi:flagellar biosynthesis/type III secretory pathway M-ring protein FliF/YscJ